MTRSAFADLIAEIRRISKLPDQSAATIARELRVTRNVVIGLAHRNSITLPGSKGRKPGQKVALPKPEAMQQPSKPQLLKREPRAIGPRTVHKDVAMPLLSNPPATPAPASETGTGGTWPAQLTPAWPVAVTGTLGSVPLGDLLMRPLGEALLVMAGSPYATVEGDLTPLADDTPEPLEDEPEPLNLPGLPITALKGAQCRWPVYPVDTDAAWASGPHRFCAGPTGDVTTPYCRHHASKAVGRGTKSERAAESILKWGARQ